jgi:hypothetical protein
MEKTLIVKEPQKDAVEELQKIKNSDKLKEVEEFQKFLNSQPKNEDVASRNIGNTSIDYLPISYIQNKLDEKYFGVWSTSDFKTEIIANEICGSVSLKVYHPKAKGWIERIGVGAVPIKLSKGSKVTELENKIKNALVTDYPHLLSECLKNAAKSLGVSFGRELNRDIVDQYVPLLERKELIAEKKRQSSELLKFISEEATTLEALEEVKDKVKSNEEKEAFETKKQLLLEKINN